MASSFPPGLQTLTGGDVRGRVDTGGGWTVLLAGADAVVLPTPPEERQQPRLRRLPVRREPPPFPELLDRAPERAGVAAAVADLRPVELYGVPGVGKTALLRHLAHEADRSGLPDGVIVLSGRRRGAEDLLQALFEAFHETDRPFKTTPEQLPQALAERRALVLVDDAELGQEEVDSLLAAAPGCAFVLASPGERLSGDVLSLRLGGLPRRSALELLAGELGRPLAAGSAGAQGEEGAAGEQGEAARLVTAAAGHPLRLLQAAALVREGELSLAQARELLASPGEGLLEAALGSLDEPRHRLLAALAALGGGPLEAEALEELSGVAGAVGACKPLVRRHLVETRGRSFALRGGVLELLAGTWDLTPWRERALAYLLRQGGREGSAGAFPPEILPAVLELFAWVQEAGRHQDALRLARAVEGSLFTQVRWEAWRVVLAGALRAAEADRDSAAEAWSLHQRGSRALALGDLTRARNALAQALALRESLGDEAGAALSRHNLEWVERAGDQPGGGAPPPGPPPGREPSEEAPALTPVAAAGRREEPPDLLLWGEEPAAGEEPAGEDEARPAERPPEEPAAETGEPALDEHPFDRDLRPSAGPPPARGPETRRRSGGGKGLWWLLAIVVLLLAGAAAWTFFLRPATVLVGPQGGIDFGEQPLSSTGPPRRVTVTSEGPRRLEIASVQMAGEAAGDFSVADDACSGRSLARGESCTVDVAFAPGEVEERQAALVVASDGAGAPHRLGLTGTGTQPLGSFVPPGLELGEQRVGTRGETRELLLVSSGTAPLEVEEVRLTGEARSFTLVDDPCSQTTLPPAGDCTLEVAFTPRKEGDLEATLEVHGPLLDFPVTARLQGTGTVPRLCLSPRSLDLGSQPLGTSGRRTLTVSSCGTAPLEVTAVAAPAAEGSFSVTGQDCSGRTLAPGGECAITVRFQPQAEGPAEARLTVAADAAGSPWQVVLSGTGTAPHAAAEPPALDFGGRLVETPGDLLELAVLNTGTAPLELGELVFAAGEGSFAVTGDGCSGQTLAPEESCQLALAFRPRREGGYQGELTLPTNAPEGPLSIPLSGRGTAPHVGAEPEAVSFGEQRVGAPGEPRRLRLVNTGTAPLQMGGLGIPGSAAFVIDPDRCSGRTLPPGGRCEVGVRFEPPEEGSHQAELRAASNAREGLLRVRLSGQGVIPRAVLSPESLELGTGNFGPRRITLENTGGAPLAVDRLVMDGDEAAFPVDRDDCAGQRLPPGRSCGIAVRFAPVRPGRHEARLTLLHDGEGDRRVRLVGDASPPAPPAGLEPGGTDLAQPQPVDGCDALTLAWRAATDAWPPVSYDLTVEQISRTGSWETVYTATTPGTEERLAEPLGRRGTYRWRVVARDGVGNHSAPSPWRYFDCVARLE